MNVRRRSRRHPTLGGDLLLGKPIPSVEADTQAIGVILGVPRLGLDALASAAYGPEAALTVLLPAGVDGIRAALPITAAVIMLLVVVCSSYWQTIGAYS